MITRMDAGDRGAQAARDTRRNPFLPAPTTAAITARRRHLDPDQDLVHVSTKCVGDMFLMRPDARTVYVIAVALAKASELYGVRLHAFCFLSNHPHLLLRCDGLSAR